MLPPGRAGEARSPREARGPAADSLHSGAVPPGRRARHAAGDCFGILLRNPPHNDRDGGGSHRRPAPGMRPSLPRGRILVAMGSAGWNGTRALVTGASSGIGAAIARELGAAGARVVLTGRNEAALARVAASSGTGASFLAGDLTDPAFRERLTEAVREHLGGLDLLVNNAGITMNARFEELESEVLRWIMEIDFFAQVELTRLVLPELFASKGRIVVMSSVTGLVGTPTRTAYAAAKHALHGLFGALRIELRSRGVSVTIACPGYVATPIRERAVLGDGREQGVDQAAGRTMLSAEDVARRTLRAAWRRRRMVLMGMETRLARILSIAAPGVLDNILEKATR